MGGGGGAGGYRCSVVGELSGSNSLAEQRYSVSANVAYPVVVGAGGAGFNFPDTPARVNQGGDSWFTNIVATGGGIGKARGCRDPEPFADGGSGGGGGYSSTNSGVGPQNTRGVSVVSQGFPQGFPGGNYNSAQGGGGGGAGGPGIDGNVANYGGDGGTGLWSSITGVSVGRAGGGQGTGGKGQSIGASQCGGGTNASTAAAMCGVANTGGGGGSKNISGKAGDGGSGVVIIRYEMTLAKGTVFMMR